VAAVPSGLSLTPLRIIIKKNILQPDSGGLEKLPEILCNTKKQVLVIDGESFSVFSRA
jgi:hypothetical protein